jgi:hypothetical protein
MAPRDPQAVLQKLGQTTLKIDSFFLRRTGFVANQTVLKLGEYTLNCVPASIGVEEARFLAVLTPSEVSLFSKFKEGTHILILTFDNPEAKDIARFPLRIGLLSIDPVPERKNICLVTVKLKSLPTELVLFLGGYLEELDERLQSWESLAADLIPYAPERALTAGLGYGAVLQVGEQRLSVEVVAFHTKTIQLRGSEALPVGPAQLRLVFQGRPLVLEGTCSPAGFSPEFQPDWLDFVEEVRFQIQLKNRNGAP